MLQMMDAKTVGWCVSLSVWEQSSELWTVVDVASRTDGEELGSYSTNKLRATAYISAS